MTVRARIERDLGLFVLGTGGIGNWLTNADDTVFDRLLRISVEPLSRVQLNQLLVLGKEAPVSEGFFDYYFVSNTHPNYDVTQLPDYKPEWLNQDSILDLAHLRWGLYRLYIDGLLYFGSVRTAFRYLRTLDEEDIHEFFRVRYTDTNRLRRRGPSLTLQSIPKDNRYLISEMACKSFGEVPATKSELREALQAAFKEHQANGGGPTTVKSLLTGSRVTKDYATTQQQLIFSADDALDANVNSEGDLDKHFGAMAESFLLARQAALENTSFTYPWCRTLTCMLRQACEVDRTFGVWPMYLSNCSPIRDCAR
jgi:hypothetical protein